MNLQRALGALVLVAFASPVDAQNLFMNGDMEDCPALPHNTAPTGWGSDSSSVGIDCDYWATGTDPGLYEGARSPRTQAGHVEGITQAVPTNIGGTYTVSYFVAGNGGLAEIRLGNRTGTLVAMETIVPGYMQVMGNFVATAASTTVYIGTDLRTAANDARIDFASITGGCGDGILGDGEACDDGNLMADDGCSSCEIDDGYECPTAGAACVDIDECADETACDENATCTNEVPGFSCECNEGYMGNGTRCEDIDECVDYDCGEHAMCVNEPGTFSCPCDEGYVLDGAGACSDIDECLTATDDCDENATCTNGDGDFSCACNDGFMGDGVTCPDIDECADGTDDCDTNATCTNTAGTFECACNDGFTGDGVTCLPDAVDPDAGPGPDAGPMGTDAGPMGTDAGPMGTDAGPGTPPPSSSGCECRTTGTGALPGAGVLLFLCVAGRRRRI